ncbi:MAG: hypothetical protein IJ002_07055 [Clostridia bacterium]|nr:hypothetical protein [Clostridia bacterium]
MKTLKTKAKHVSNTSVIYTSVYDGNTYSLEIRSYGDFDGYILVDDVTRDADEAEKIANLFADNLVFPDNALEVLDDYLGTI